MNDRIIVESTGAACALMLAGFPMERAYLGARGRTLFVFPAEAAIVLDAYRRASNEVQATIARVKQSRRQEPQHDHPQR